MTELSPTNPWFIPADARDAFGWPGEMLAELQTSVAEEKAIAEVNEHTPTETATALGQIASQESTPGSTIRVGRHRLALAGIATSLLVSPLMATEAHAATGNVVVHNEGDLAITVCGKVTDSWLSGNRKCRQQHTVGSWQSSAGIVEDANGILVPKGYYLEAREGQNARRGSERTWTRVASGDNCGFGKDSKVVTSVVLPTWKSYYSNDQGDSTKVRLLDCPDTSRPAKNDTIFTPKHPNGIPTAKYWDNQRKRKPSTQCHQILGFTLPCDSKAAKKSAKPAAKKTPRTANNKPARAKKAGDPRCDAPWPTGYPTYTKKDKC